MIRLRQWQVWKALPAGFGKAHYFVLFSNQERLDSSRPQINGLACFTLRGEALKSDVRLNGADGFSAPTVCQCDLIYLLNKSDLQEPAGFVSAARQQQIQVKVREVFRL